MIIKTADDHASDINTLQSLLHHPAASPAIQKKIDIEIRRIKAGARGEAASAYEIDRHFGDHADYAVIHDLRIVVGDQVAQIDHLIINRSMSAFLCETKNFSDGLGCNEHGEWVGFRNGKPFGIPSPLHQGKRHCDILQSLLLQRNDWHPRRLGEYIGVNKEHFVLVSNSARISRPKEGSVPDIDRVTKIEAFAERRRMFADRIGIFESVMKHISSDALRTFAEGLASCHAPATPDWFGKFGLAPVAAAREPEPIQQVAMAQAALVQVGVTEVADSEMPGASEELGKTKLVCATCGDTIPFIVARFCWRNKRRFSGKIFCRECQAGV